MRSTDIQGIICNLLISRAVEGANSLTSRFMSDGRVCHANNHSDPLQIMGRLLVKESWPDEQELEPQRAIIRLVYDELWWFTLGHKPVECGDQPA